LRLSLTRFSVRRMVVDVALVVGIVGFLAMWNRSVEYERRATRHEEHDERFQHKYKTAREHVAKYGSRWMPLHDAPEFVERMGDYHEEMARKYRRAARFPWLTVEPDPSEPTVP
jgi:hypothetical protein